MYGFIAIIFCSLTVTASSSYPGFIGCRFSSAICHSDETCVDDNLFGNCQKKTVSDNIARDLFKYELQPYQLLELERIITDLANAGYTWSHLYTQCVLTKSLLVYRHGVHVEDDFCEGRRETWEPSVRSGGLGQSTRSRDQEIVNSLVQLIQSGYYESKRRTSSSSSSVEKTGSAVNAEVPRSYKNDRNDDAADVDRFLRSLSEADLIALKEFLIEEGKTKHISTTNNSSTYSLPETTVGSETTRQVLGSTDGFYLSYDVQLSTSNLTTTVNFLNVQQPVDSIGAISVAKDDRGEVYFVIIYALCGVLAGLLVAAALIHLVQYIQKRDEKTVPSSAAVSSRTKKSSNAYQDLCRHHSTVMSVRNEENFESHQLLLKRATSFRQRDNNNVGDAASPYALLRANSSGAASSLSWFTTDEPPVLDISTGHLLLSYMEDHLRNQDRLHREWQALCDYDPDPCSVIVASLPANQRKNRSASVLPYEHSRVRLNADNNMSESDYINASNLADHDPKSPSYIATQGPLDNTVADFWQMIWEQGSVVIVSLTCLNENGQNLCHQYWPEIDDLYHIYEVKLVSVHPICDDYVVRNFRLRNILENETRTITQFQYLAWSEHGIPASVQSLLDFRIKVNSSFRGRPCPIIVHCSDGASRTGTYCLIDMSLNRLAKEIKEIDLAATLEHLRDQRMNMVHSEEQFAFALSAVIQGVQSLLCSALGQ